MRARYLLAFAAAVVGAVAAKDGQSSSSVQSPGEDEGKQLIMLEVERLEYPEDKVVKRQAQVQYGGAPGQFVVRTSDLGSQQQVPPEYLTLLHQLSPRQSQPHEIQQVFITRNPQESYAEFSSQPAPAPAPAPAPQPPRLTPEQEQMRRLQEEQANKHIREQQERALQRALQTGQFQTGFQPQPYQLAQQVYQPQPQPQQYRQLPPQPQEYETQPPQSLPQYDSLEPHYSQPSAPQYYQQTRSIRPSQAPQKYSYSEVQFGSPSDEARENLEQRLVSIQQKLQSQVTVKPEYYSPQPSQQIPQPQQVDYSSLNVQPQQQTPTQPQHPQQYLIETTHLRSEQNEEPVVTIPRPRRPPPPPPQSLYFRPQAPPAPVAYKPPEPYTTIPNNYLSPQYPNAPRYVQQNLPSPDAPSRSAIYVQQSGVSRKITTQQPSNYNNYYTQSPRIPRIPTPGGQRPLTSSEIEALSKAGFNISPLALNRVQEPSEISPSYEQNDDYRSPNNKRQSQYIDERKPPGKYPKRIPKPVPLTETERKLLADQGIRNLYRVESSESKDAPVTYVLAIDNTIRKRESDMTSDEESSS